MKQTLILGAFICVFSLFTALQAKSPSMNATGYGDTSMLDSVKSTTVFYSKSFPLSAYEDCRADLFANDTATAGFSTDSIKLQWGFQTWHLALDNAGNLDTVFSNRVVLDTMDVDSFGQARVWISAPNGSLTGYCESNVDTSKVTGFAVQSVWFVPPWDVKIRFWVQGLTNNKAGDGLAVIIGFIRRLYTNVRDQ